MISSFAADTATVVAVGAVKHAYRVRFAALDSADCCSTLMALVTLGGGAVQGSCHVCRRR